MTQFDYGNIDEAATSGTDLGLLLEQSRDANHSLQKGPIRPTYATQGMIWIDDSVSPWKVNFFDGVSDLKLAQIDEVGHVLEIFNKGVALALVATSGDYNDLINTPNVNDVKVSPDDTNPGKLESKIVAGNGVAFTTLNPAANEQLEISSNFASQAEAEAGVISNKNMTPLTSKQAIKAQLDIDNFFKSTPQAVPADNVLLSIPHGLGTTPNLATVTIECISADSGYAIGDVIELKNDSASPFSGVAIYYNATSINFVRNSDNLTDPSGLGFPWSRTKWNLVFRAWV